MKLLTRVFSTLWLLLMLTYSINAQNYQDNWESLKQYRIPEWFCDAKFGIFIHWGVYSVPAFGSEWYPRNMYLSTSPEFKHHRDKYGDQSKFGYKDFIPMFKAERWNPKAWAELFKKAGAKYVVPVAEHHDGFAMYATKYSRWNAVSMGPKRDIIGELARAVRQEGLIFGLSTHREEHWWFYHPGTLFDSDARDTAYADFYGPARPDSLQPDEKYLNDWLNRDKELVEEYQPQLVWFDWWIEQPAYAPFLRKFAAYFYNKGIEWQKGVVINYKNQAFADKTAVFDMERGKVGTIEKVPWQTDTSIGMLSWGYIDGEKYKSPQMIIQNLVDIVSKNGNLLLNIGPRPDGTIPEEAQATLLEIGKWLSINGEAIYGTRPWVRYGEGPTLMGEGSFSDNEEIQFTPQDFRFTRKGECIYAMSLAWAEPSIRITSLGRKSSGRIDIGDVSMLGSKEKLSWKQEDHALVINSPVKRPSDYCYVFKIQVKPGSHVMGKLNIKQDKEYEAEASATFMNMENRTWHPKVYLVVNGDEVKSQNVSIDAYDHKDVVFTYEHNKTGSASVAIGFDDCVTTPLDVAFPVVRTAGEWKFKRGNDEAWKDPTLNDSDWETVTLPSSWEKTSGYTADSVYGWYRKTIVVPAEWSGHSLAIPLGTIDDVDETYFNGVRIGGQGQFPPSYSSAYNIRRIYVVPSEAIRYGGRNTIAIKVFDLYGEGGVTNGPMGAIELIKK